MNGCSGCTNGKCSVKLTAEKSTPTGPGLATLIRQALISLSPLVFGFIAAYTLTALLYPESSDDAGRAAAGVLGLLAAGALVYLLRRVHIQKTQGKSI